MTPHLAFVQKNRCSFKTFEIQMYVNFYQSFRRTHALQYHKNKLTKPLSLLRCLFLCTQPTSLFASYINVKPRLNMILKTTQEITPHYKGINRRPALDRKFPQNAPICNVTRCYKLDLKIVVLAAKLSLRH